MAGSRRGPATKRTEERERRNTPGAGEAILLGPDDFDQLPFEVETLVEPPPPGEKWEQGARDFYEATLRDPARIWMGPADWAFHWIICENLHRELAPQYVAVAEGGVDLETGEKVSDHVVRERLPIKGASLNAYLRWASLIGIGEASRLALRREITFNQEPTTELASVHDLDVADTREGIFQDGGR